MSVESQAQVSPLQPSHAFHQPGEEPLTQKKGQVGEADAELRQIVEINCDFTMMFGTVGLAGSWKLWSMPLRCSQAS